MAGRNSPDLVYQRCVLAIRALARTAAQEKPAPASESLKAKTDAELLQLITGDKELVVQKAGPRYTTIK